MSNEPDPEKKIVVDTDWKEQVRQEKAKQQAVEAQSTSQDPPAEPQAEPSGKTESRSATANQVPKPDFQVLISMLATQAFAALGQIPDPTSGERLHQPEAAQFMIDLLAVLEEKTKGNLSTEEHAMLDGILHDLRMAYVAVVKGM